ncbi:MAG: RNA 3'-phosphate cyclase [Candidatus Tectomicrobia bacterium]|uniref:RNA 3'-terminal phosphate cyclase n=1 Tax=Tectimicrobiota bacterium TaxID=2528274 RepID=A0A932CQN5_UNCTE|nr:RNA 3'-phosphate cyclase [Candidatus Tectomicrobia bacterium]
MGLKIDGSYGEGGGQILRTALALSVILRQPVEIANIRARRKRPGLRPQHLAGVRALAEVSQAEVWGDGLGSSFLSFSPGQIRSGAYTFDVAEETRSAGAVSLLFQALALPLAYGSGPSEVRLRGGTHVSWSPPFHYLTEVLLPTLARAGYRADLWLQNWGWYPVGGGVVDLRVEPLNGLQPLTRWKRGALQAIQGLSAASNLPVHVAERQARRAKERLLARGLPVEIQIIPAPSPGQGSFLFLVALSEGGMGGFSALGARGKRAEAVADEAVDALIQYLDSGCALDEHLADQLIPFLALAPGDSGFTTSRISQHLLTNLWVVRQFLPVEFTVEGEEGSPGAVKVTPSRQGEQVSPRPRGLTADP